MITVFSPLHAGHSGQRELVAGAIVPAFEKPERAEIIRARIEAVGLGPVRAPGVHDLSVAAQVHDADYLAFLAQAHDLWVARGNDGPALPFVWPVATGPGGARRDRVPADIEGMLGLYTFDGGAPFVAGTWAAVKAAQDAALTAAGLVAEGQRAAFALTRPPGHHAGRRLAGGYCYINHAAVAAQALRNAGARRVAVLDIDYHHGNGTQDIFWERGDVMVVSLHADPVQEYPYFAGHADETGAGDGAGATLNLPMPHGTGVARWSEALGAGLAALARFAPDALVVSLGTDTFEGDPISQFRLRTADFPVIGARIGAAGWPTVFIMEGGYAVEEIGLNAVGVLTGFEDA